MSRQSSLAIGEFFSKPRFERKSLKEGEATWSVTSQTKKRTRPFLVRKNSLKSIINEQLIRAVAFVDVNETNSTPSSHSQGNTDENSSRR